MIIKGVNKDILVLYLNTIKLFNKNILDISNLTIIYNEIIFFKVKFEDGEISELFNLDFSKYKIFERKYKLQQLDCL